MNEPTQWSPPTPLRPGKSNFISFPTEALPSVLREMAEAVAETTSTDVAMAGTALLSAVGYCFTEMYRMYGKADHSEPLVLNSLTIAEPSFKKSPVMALVKRPFIQFTTEWNVLNQDVIIRSQAEKKLLESQLAALEKKKDVTLDEVSELQKQIQNLEVVELRRIVVDDITPESLVRQMNINGSLLMISDEAGMLGNFSGRYSNNIPNLDLLLKSWNGETYISDRATRDSIILKNPYLTICLACQPYILEDLMNNQAFRGSGLIARFVYCFPESNIGSRKYDTKPISEAVASNYKNLIFGLLNRKFNYNGEEQALYFTNEAYKTFVDYYNDYIEPLLVTDMYFCRDWGGKYHGLILRLCGIIHCVKCAVKGVEPTSEKVDVDTLCNAESLAYFYQKHAIYAYSLGDVDIATVKAERVLNKIRSMNIKEKRQNDLYKLCRCTLFKNAADFAETMEMLEEYGYIKRDTVPGANGNNKSGIMVFINPNI